MRCSRFNNNIDITKELEIEYKDIDPQKGALSPRELFSNKKTHHDLIDNRYIIDKIENTVEAYCGLVNDFYFNNEIKEITEEADSEMSTEFKMSSLDFLINPLRTPLPFEMWSPYEIALFEACLCKFGRDFELISKIITTKTRMEIQEFFYQWEKSRYHDLWLMNVYKKRPINK